MNENPTPRKLSKAIHSVQFAAVVLATLVLWGLVRSSTMDLLDIPGMGTLNAREISKPGEKWLLYSLYATVPFVLLRWWHLALFALGNAVAAFGVLMGIAYHKVTSMLENPDLDESTRTMIEETIASTELERGFHYLAAGMVLLFLLFLIAHWRRGRQGITTSTR